MIEHGFQRGTEDADILVSKEQRDLWIEIVRNCGYTLLHDAGTFLQFEPERAEPNRWDVDVMLVPSSAFERLLAAAESATIEAAAVMVPSLEHLLALKVHALKNGKGLRVLKDMTDVAELLKANRVDPKTPWLKAIFERYGDTEMYERIIKLLA